MFLSFSKKMIQNTGNRVCYTLDFPTIDDFGANEVGLPLMILSDHFETAPVLIQSQPFPFSDNSENNISPSSLTIM